jgi:hypothetical protein
MLAVVMIVAAIAYFLVAPIDFWLRLGLGLFFMGIAIESLHEADWHIRLFRLYFRLKPFGSSDYEAEHMHRTAHTREPNMSSPAHAD